MGQSGFLMRFICRVILIYNYVDRRGKSFFGFIYCILVMHTNVIMNFVEEKLRKAFLRVNCSKGDEFIQGIKTEIERKQRRGREDKKIRYNIYCRWALQLLKAGV